LSSSFSGFYCSHEVIELIREKAQPEPARAPKLMCNHRLAAAVFLRQTALSIYELIPSDLGVYTDFQEDIPMVSSNQR
jgi:hypothetical protein